MLYEHVTGEHGDYVSRTILDSFKFSQYDTSAWEPMTKEEYDSVTSAYKEIYD